MYSLIINIYYISFCTFYMYYYVFILYYRIYYKFLNSIAYLNGFYTVTKKMFIIQRLYRIDESIVISISNIHNYYLD